MFSCPLSSVRNAATKIPKISKVTRFSDILKIYWRQKWPKYLSTFVGYLLLKWHFYVKLLRNLFGQILQKIGLLFTPTSGRTESDLSIFVKVFSCPTWANENKVVCRSLSSHFCTSANKYFALKMENFLKVSGHFRPLFIFYFCVTLLMS